MNRLLMQGLYERAHTKDERIHVGINVFCAYAQGSRHEGRSCPRPNLCRSHRRRTTSSGSRRCSIHMTPCFCSWIRARVGGYRRCWAPPGQWSLLVFFPDYLTHPAPSLPTPSSMTAIAFGLSYVIPIIFRCIFHSHPVHTAPCIRFTF